MAAFRDARADLVALGPRIGALRVGDVAAARAMEPDLIALDLAATRMVDRRAPADPIRRDLLRRDGLRADAALGLTAMLLSLGLLLKASAMARQTGERERARQNPDARGAELSRALALAQAGAGATSAVLATIGHEIRTPMNGVLGATSLLAHTKLTDTQRRWVDLARESGEAVLRQLDDVLDCSALEAAPSRREPVFALDAARRITFGAGLDPAAASPLSPQDGRLRLLLADDDPINREVASSLLRHLGHDVTAVGGGPDAYAEAQMGRYDCILLDLHMPGMDGVELARALRALPLPLGAVRLVAITADADAGVHEAARSAGIDSVVTKPVTLERLADALSHEQSLGPLTEPPAIDAAMRRGLVERLAAGRFAGLLATFWGGLLATLAEGDPWTGDDGDRRLHSLAGASASLGYRAVAAAARRARADRAAGVAGGNAAVLAALAAAARGDRSLLPPDLAERLEAALADASPTAATIPAIAGSRP